MRNQVDRLAKKGKPELKQAWQKAKEGGKPSGIFVIMRSCSARMWLQEKDSVQEETQSTSLKKGWMTMYTYGRLQGLDPQQEDFQEMCLVACEGLPTRELAKAGVKQVYAEVQGLDTEQQSHKGLVKAKQEITGEDVAAETFESVEDAVKVTRVAGQIVLGGHQKQKELKEFDATEEIGRCCWSVQQPVSQG